MKIKTRRHVVSSVYAEIGRRMREIPLEPHISSYEWEELVQKLCSSDDDGLRDIGAKELYDLQHQCPVDGVS